MISFISIFVLEDSILLLIMFPPSGSGDILFIPVCPSVRANERVGTWVRPSVRHKIVSALELKDRMIYCDETSYIC